MIKKLVVLELVLFASSGCTAEDKGVTEETQEPNKAQESKQESKEETKKLLPKSEMRMENCFTILC